MKLDVHESIMLNTGLIDVFVDGEMVDQCFEVDTEIGTAKFHVLDENENFTGERETIRGDICVKCDGRIVSEYQMRG